MFDRTTILSNYAMKQSYGDFYSESPQVSLNKKKVPEELWPILPYAEFWGISDDSTREILIQKAPPEVQTNLKLVVAMFNEKMDNWLAGSEAENPRPSREYLAFSAMRMAADFI